MTVFLDGIAYADYKDIRTAHSLVLLSCAPDTHRSETHTEGSSVPQGGGPTAPVKL